MEFLPEIVGLTEENAFLIDRIFTHSQQRVAYKVPRWIKVGTTYEFSGWATSPQVVTTSNMLREFGTGNASLRHLPLASNASVEYDELTGITKIILDHGSSNLEALETGLTLQTSKRQYWPKLEHTTTYFLRDAEVGEISSIMPWLTKHEDGSIINNTWVNEVDWHENVPNGQNALAMKPMNLSWWVDLMQGGEPGNWHNQGVVFPIVGKLRYSPENFGYAIAWDSVAGSFPSYDPNKGAVLRLRLVNNSGIYDSIEVNGEPKTWMAECYLNVHTGECKLG